jgi:hypothetical protein
MMLPPNQPRRFDVKLTHPPRAMHPFFYNSPQVFATLVAVPMEHLRQVSTGRCKETPQARRNLQQWIETLGPALYNPVLWIRKPNARWITIKGQHRTRALKALDFDLVYAYVVIGDYNAIPNNIVKVMRKNGVRPTYSTWHAQCANCHKQITKGRYTQIDDDYTRHYDCFYCRHVGTNREPYPEPV